MSDQDPLTFWQFCIDPHCRHPTPHYYTRPQDGDVGEVNEVERLRDLLGRLEWAGTHCERDREMAACPVCDVLADSPVVGQQPHAPDCWLVAELHPGTPNAPPQLPKE